MKDRINYYIFLPLIFAAFILETAFFPSVLEGAVRPDLVFILLLASVFLSVSSDFLYTAFFFGFLFDAYFAGGFGTFTVSMVVASIFASMAKEKLMKEESFGKAVRLSVIGMLFYDAAFLFLTAFAFGANEILDLSFIWKEALADSAYAALLVYPMMHLISKGKE
jgi:rod shape-determining protein MreD